MSRSGWFILAAIGGTLIVILIAVAYGFRESWFYPKPLGGPVAIVKADAPTHGFLGIEFTGATAPLSVQSVLKGSGAADAGLQPRDVIISAGSAEKPDLAALQRVIEASAPGDDLLVKVGRGQDEIEIRVRLISSTDMIVLLERERSGKALDAGGGESAQAAEPTPPSPEQLATAKASGVPVEATNSIGMKLVLIPAGEFMMGSHETAEHAAAFFRETYGGWVNAGEMRGEHPQHRVQITKPFYLGKYHVTRGQFQQFVADTGYKTDAEKGTGGALGWNPEKKTFEGKEAKKDYSWRNAGFEQTDEHPVINVSWNDAVAFCEWLSRKEGKTYRLPTEAEQEYACRAGTTTRYYSGDDPETLGKVGNVADATAKPMFPLLRHTIIASDGYVFTAPVGSFEPNAFGVYDMHGNAWQWCSDARVLRGGSCQSGPVEARSAFRWDVKREGCILWPTGFRVARTL